MSAQILDSVVFVTGANGGLGTEFVRQALARGARKVYASARTVRDWDDERIVGITLDVTDQASVDAAAASAADTTVLVNNAGVYTHGDRITAGSLDDIRAVFETNFFGAVAVARAFAPVVGANGGGAILDVHSALSWAGFAGAYSASKAALWSATNSLRLELAPQGTHVVGLHMGYVDTPMVADIRADKSSPRSIVSAAYDAVESGEYEVLADLRARVLKKALSGPIEELYTELRA
ncbi:SDR family oxidoreductase [Conyzicola nivalis]|uniref:Oxidoreductase n=1 Tax=Conyzicola nivalis TaxID=1477021 RepID=A0A916S9U9_9MICO|nr:SDR family oxidoreductase [Conyzicola nivalis]GGA90775.1 oxidoreductase [Conyzicola nivalis]